MGASFWGEGRGGWEKGAFSFHYKPSTVKPICPLCAHTALIGTPIQPCSPPPAVGSLQIPLSICLRPHLLPLVPHVTPCSPRYLSLATPIGSVVAPKQAGVPHVDAQIPFQGRAAL